MYAIAGITGRVGGAAARRLLAEGRPVRAVLRDAAKGEEWVRQGAELAIADFKDADALARAFTGAEGVFVMVPPYSAPDPGFAGAHAAAEALAQAIRKAKPGRVVALSSVGAYRSSGLGLITQSHILERALADTGVPTAILRPAWFMENSAWDIAPARETGEMPSFLQPLDRPFPMVATQDIGRIAAATLQEDWAGTRVIEIEGPRRYSQAEIASLLGAVLGRAVTAKPVPRSEWEALFRARGSAHPAPRLEMLDGFNTGWIDFEPDRHEHVAGTTRFKAVLVPLAKSA